MGILDECRYTDCKTTEGWEWTKHDSSLTQCDPMETDLFSAAAYGEYLSIDDRLKLASFRFSCDVQVSDPSAVINQQDEYGLTMLMEGSYDCHI